MIVDKFMLFVRSGTTTIIMVRSIHVVMICSWRGSHPDRGSSAWKVGATLKPVLEKIEAEGNDLSVDTGISTLGMSTSGRSIWRSTL